MEKLERENLKQFDLGAILNITSSRMFTNMNDIFEVLNYLTSDDVFVHEIPKVMETARPHILSLYPELEGVGEDVVINNFLDAKEFVAAQKKIYGDQLPLTPMSKADSYARVDSIMENLTSDDMMESKQLVFIKK